MLLNTSLRVEKRGRRPALCAVLSALFMGLGQMLNRQFLKGALYMAAHVMLVFWAAPYLSWGIEDLITLGYVPMRDHSLFAMVYGILSLIALVFIIVFYVLCITDAYKCAKKLQNYEQLPTFRQGFRNTLSRRAPLFFAAPGVLAVCAIVVLPLVFSIIIGFTDYDAYHQPPAKILEWVGMQNYVQIFQLETWAHTFRSILLWTLSFTVLSSVLPYAFGIGVAVLLNHPRLRFRRVFKTIMVLPWAIPSYISIMVWRGMFDTNNGIINSFIRALGLEGVPWMQDGAATRVALVIISVWSGFTFPMLIADSIMKSIPSELYEAAKLDGASSVRSFFAITFPMLFFSISPLFIMSVAGAFNNFNIIYLFSEGGPPNLSYMGAGNTDNLISWIYKLTYTAQKYNYASAITFIIFIFLAVFSIINLSRTKSFREEEMLQ